VLRILQARLKQKHRTIRYPAGAPPALPDRFAGRPIVAGPAPADFSPQQVCPTGALSFAPAGMPTPKQPAWAWHATDSGRSLCIDTGRCLFCRACERASGGAIKFTGEHRLAAAKREDLVVASASPTVPAAANELAKKLFSKSLKLRQVSAGGCNACEADCNVLGTPAWDMGRFGISFVASPRHADGLLITGPVSENMRLALLKTYEAVPSPKIVIAVGACAISGGPFRDHVEVHNGAAGLLPVDLFVPGCPPHPLTILDALLRLIGLVNADGSFREKW
jgi:Ni,Fe-hydrogenase III small subunit